MWQRNIIFVCSILACGVEVFGVFNKLIIKGKWKVENVAKCENADQYEYDFNLKKKKMNRTHDGFDLDVDLPTEINKEDYGIYIEACMQVDGGCKLVQVFNDSSFCEFINKHAEKNFKAILANAGLEEDCPIPAGYHKVVDYTFDYNELPEEGMCGNFKTTLYLTKNGDERLACVIIYVVFEDAEDDE